MKKNNFFTVMLCAVLLSGCAAPKEIGKPSTVVDNSSTSSNSESSSGSSDSTNSTDSTESNESTDSTASDSYNKGDTIKTDNWEVTVNSVEIMSEIKASEYTAFKPDEGNKYMVVNVTAKNVNKEAKTFLPSVGLSSEMHAKIKYQDYEFSAVSLLGYDEDLHNTHLNPLSSKTGVIVFSVADEVAEKVDELHLVLSEDEASFDFVLQ